MKKTLAAVLAAMMALSTATVALAKDVNDAAAGLDGVAGSGAADHVEPIRVNDEGKYYFTVGAFGGATDGLSAEQLGWLIDENLVDVTVKVTDGRSNLASLPSIKVANDGAAQLKIKFADSYKVNTIAPGTEKDPMKATVKVDITFKKNIYWTAEGLNMTATAPAKDSNPLDGMKKGDTVHLDPISFKAGYHETDDYGTDMTFTKTEVKNRETVIFGETLYNETEDETLTIYFDDIAAWSGEISEHQQNLNVFYAWDQDEDLVDAYDDVEFEFLTFKGAPKFVKSGELTFNAIGGEDTVVYEVIDGDLVELTTEYDSTYDVVTVDGVKKLTSYVIASEALEVEVEAEPEVEEPAVEEENPNTGAC